MQIDWGEATIYLKEIYDAFATVQTELSDIEMFHTDYAEEKTIPKFFL